MVSRLRALEELRIVQTLPQRLLLVFEMLARRVVGAINRDPHRMTTKGHKLYRSVDEQT